MGTTPLGVGSPHRHRGCRSPRRNARRGARRQVRRQTPAATSGALLPERSSSAATGGCGRAARTCGRRSRRCGVALYQPAFFAGTQRNVAVGTIVALGSGPVFVGLWEALWQRRRPSALDRRDGVGALRWALLVAAERYRDSAATITVFRVLCRSVPLRMSQRVVGGLIDEGVDSGLAMTWVFVAGAAVAGARRRTARLAASGGGDGAAPRPGDRDARLPALRLRAARWLPHRGHADARSR